MKIGAERLSKDADGSIYCSKRHLADPPGAFLDLTA